MIPVSPPFHVSGVFIRYLIWCFLLVSTVDAADGDRTRYDIPAGEAAVTFRQYTAISGHDILFAAEAVRGVRTTAVNGEYTPAAALEQMLAGTNLMAMQDNRTGAFAVRRAISEPILHHQTNQMTSSQPSPKTPRLVGAIASIFAVAFSAGPDAQGQAARSTPSPAVEESIILSPFIVSGERDTGYAATDSLAGTRLRTSLKDIAASVSVVTKDFLTDVGATNTADVLVYTTGTEVVGVGGNFSNSSSATYNQSFEAQRQDANPATRIRGLAGADQTRNYFLSPYIPVDSYNTQSVTINRGANAILFGFGSPAGIIENSLVAPQFKNKGEVQLRVSSYGGYRESLDFEQVLLPHKLAVRVTALDERRKYEQEPAYRDQRRLFGAMTFKPFSSTTLRINAETGKLDQRLPRVDPPLDSLTTWWAFGQKTRDNLFYPSSVTAYQRLNNLDGQAADWAQNPGLIYPSATASLPNDAYVAYASAGGGVVYRHLGPRSTKEIALFVEPIDPLAAFQVGRQITDRSIFDYRKKMLDGPNNGVRLNFNAVNAALEQLFLGGNAGIELVVDRQESRQVVSEGYSSYRGNNIFIDVNTVTTDGRPNENFGRPYIASKGAFNRNENHLDTGRLTGFIKHDFRSRWGFFGRLLGTQSLTGLHTSYESSQYLLTGPLTVTEPTFRSGLNNNVLDDRAISSVIYLGPSLANAKTPVGANIPSVQVDTTVPSQYPIWILNTSTGNKWVVQTPKIYSFPDYEWITRDVNVAQNKAKSYAFISQGNWWDNLIASTVGWRSDSVNSASATSTINNPATGARSLERPPMGPGLKTDNRAFSYGGALHVPAKWFRGLPGRPTLSLYYNQSQNFTVVGVRRSVTGAFLPPQEGSTKEYGVGLTALDNRVSLRATWYETTQENTTDSRISGSLNRIADTESRIVASFTKTYLDSIGFVGADSANVSQKFKDYLNYYNFTIVNNANGSRTATYSSPPGTAEITSSVSKGLEIEGVFNPMKNWRISFNAAKQQAVRGDTSPTLTALIGERIVQYRNAGIWPRILNGQTWTLDAYVMTNLVNPINTAKLSIGEKTSELREWRANFVTNYTFGRETMLKGWAIGGAARWQDKVAIGYPVITHPELGLVTDIKHPYMGSDEIDYDGWISYQRKLFRGKIGWKIQLNIKNLLNENLLIPVKANPVKADDIKTRTIAAYRMGEGRTWQLTSTFSF